MIVAGHVIHVLAAFPSHVYRLVFAAKKCDDAAFTPYCILESTNVLLNVAPNAGYVLEVAPTGETDSLRVAQLMKTQERATGESTALVATVLQVKHACLLSKWIKPSDFIRVLPADKKRAARKALLSPSAPVKSPGEALDLLRRMQVPGCHAAQRLALHAFMFAGNVWLSELGLAASRIVPLTLSEGMFILDAVAQKQQEMLHVLHLTPDGLVHPVDGPGFAPSSALWKLEHGRTTVMYGELPPELAHVAYPTQTFDEKPAWTPMIDASAQTFLDRTWTALEWIETVHAVGQTQDLWGPYVDDDADAVVAPTSAHAARVGSHVLSVLDRLPTAVEHLVVVNAERFGVRTLANVLIQTTPTRVTLIGDATYVHGSPHPNDRGAPFRDLNARVKMRKVRGTAVSLSTVAPFGCLVADEHERARARRMLSASVIHFPPDAAARASFLNLTCTFGAPGRSDAFVLHSELGAVSKVRRKHCLASILPNGEFETAPLVDDPAQHLEHVVYELEDASGLDHTLCCRTGHKKFACSLVHPFAPAEGGWFAPVVRAAVGPIADYVHLEVNEHTGFEDVLECAGLARIGISFSQELPTVMPRARRPAVAQAFAQAPDFLPRAYGGAPEPAAEHVVTTCGVTSDPDTSVVRAATLEAAARQMLLPAAPEAAVDTSVPVFRRQKPPVEIFAHFSRALLREACLARLDALKACDGKYTPVVPASLTGPHAARAEDVAVHLLCRVSVNDLDRVSWLPKVEGDLMAARGGDAEAQEAAVRTYLFSLAPYPPLADGADEETRSMYALLDEIRAGFTQC